MTRSLKLLCFYVSDTSDANTHRDGVQKDDAAGPENMFHIPLKAQGTEATQLSTPENNTFSCVSEANSDRTKGITVITTVQALSKEDTRIPVPSDLAGSNLDQISFQKMDFRESIHETTVNQLSEPSRLSDTRKQQSDPKPTLDQDFQRLSTIESTFKLADSASTTHLLLEIDKPTYTIGQVKEGERKISEYADSATTEECKLRSNDEIALSHEIDHPLVGQVISESLSANGMEEKENPKIDAAILASIVSENSASYDKLQCTNLEFPFESTDLGISDQSVDQQSQYEAPNLRWDIVFHACSVYSKHMCDNTNSRF